MTGSKSSSEPERRGAPDLAGVGRADPPRDRWCRWSPGSARATCVFDAWQRLSPRDLSDSDVRVVLIDSRKPRVGRPVAVAALSHGAADRGDRRSGRDGDRLRHLVFRARPGPPRQLRRALSRAERGRRRRSRRARADGPPVRQGRRHGAGGARARRGRRRPVERERPLAETVRFTGQLPARLRLAGPARSRAIPEIDDAALGHGLVNGRPDSDGVVRSVPLVMRVGGTADARLRVRGRPRQPRCRHGRGFGRSSFGSAAARSRSTATAACCCISASCPRGIIVSADAVIRRCRSRSRRFRRQDRRWSACRRRERPTSSRRRSPPKTMAPLVQAQAVDAILRGGALERPRWAGPAEWAAALALALLALLAAWGGRARRFAVAVALRRAARRQLVRFPGHGVAARPGPAAARRRRRRGRRGDRVVRACPAASGAGSREVLVQERLAAAAAEGELQAARAIQLSMVPPRASLAAIDPRIDVDALLEPARIGRRRFLRPQQDRPRPHRLRDRRRHRQGRPGGAVHGHVQGADALGDVARRPRPRPRGGGDQQRTDPRQS